MPLWKSLNSVPRLFAFMALDVFADNKILPLVSKKFHVTIEGATKI